MKSTLQESIIPLNDIHESTLLQTAPWIIKKPKVILKLNELTKNHPSTYQEKFGNSHSGLLYIFMYGSKNNSKTTCAAVLNKTILKKALPMESSIFTVEAHAINLALNIILKSNQP